MIKSLQIQNFRCFEDVDLTDFGRINVIVGENGSGKTALLEAIRLAMAGTPQMAFWLTQIRQPGAFIPMGTTKEQFEAYWNPLFFRVDPDRIIFLKFADDTGKTASVKIHYDKERQVTPLPTQPFQVSLVSTIFPLAFRRTDAFGNESMLHASVSAQGGAPTFENGVELGSVAEFFPSTLLYNPQQNAVLYSQLSLSGKENEALESLEREFPLITGLSVLTPIAGQFASVYASVQGMQMKLPLTFVSAGINKYFTILAEILTHPEGVVLIDELENGIYFERLGSLWKDILRLAMKYKTQVFVSTHSFECLEALKTLLEENESEFRLIRPEMDGGRSSPKLMTGVRLGKAIFQNIDVR